MADRGPGFPIGPIGANGAPRTVRPCPTCFAERAWQRQNPRRADCGGLSAVFAKKRNTPKKRGRMETLKIVSWDFLHSEVPYLTVAYLVLKKILPRFADEKKGAFKRSLFLYNIGMSLFSLSIFAMLASYLRHNWPMFKPDCGEAAFRDPIFRTAALLFYYSKYVEYMDTFWLLLKGKSVSFLQVRRLHFSPGSMAGAHRMRRRHFIISAPR